MRIYIIKHKGANQLYNMDFSLRIELSNNTGLYAGRVFYRKKHAERFLKARYTYPEFFEVVGATIDKTNADNRYPNRIKPKQ